MKLQTTSCFKLRVMVGCLLAVILFYAGGLNKVLPFLIKNEYYSTNNLAYGNPNELAIATFTNGSIAQDSRTRDTGIAEGHFLIRSSDCYSCHGDHKVLLAPSFHEIAVMYKTDKGAIPKLANKVIAGSKGIWGERPMPPHPELLRDDAQKMIQYILNLNKQHEPGKLPVKSS